MVAMKPKRGFKLHKSLMLNSITTGSQNTIKPSVDFSGSQFKSSAQKPQEQIKLPVPQISDQINQSRNSQIELLPAQQLDQPLVEHTQDETNGLKPVEPKYYVRCSACVWTKQSFGIFDYETTEALQTSHFCFKGSRVITKMRQNRVGSFHPQFLAEQQAQDSDLSDIDYKMFEGVCTVAYSQGSYYVYQKEAPQIDLGEQERRNDHFISESLKLLSEKAFRVARDSTIPEITVRRKKLKNMLKKEEHHPDLYDDGLVIRSGDLIKFGRVPYLIKESSIDLEKKTIEKLEQRRKKASQNSQLKERQALAAKAAAQAQILQFSDAHIQGDLELPLDEDLEHDDPILVQNEPNENSQIDVPQRNQSSAQDLNPTLEHAQSEVSGPQNTAIASVQQQNSEIVSRADSNVDLNNQYRDVPNTSELVADRRSSNPYEEVKLDYNNQTHQQMLQRRNQVRARAQDDMTNLSQLPASDDLRLSTGRQTGRNMQHNLTLSQTRSVDQSRSPYQPNIFSGSALINSTSGEMVVNNTSTNTPSNLGDDHLESRKKKLIDTILKREKSIQDNQNAKVCRICLGDAADKDSSSESSPDKKQASNPLVAPCECSGSAQYIHIKCLREWLTSKATVRKNNYTTNYVYKVNKCELCQTTYPDQVILNNKKVEIYDIERPKDKHYMVLEVLGMPSGKNIQVITIPNEGYVQVGRGEEADFRVADISVSRFHSLIRYDQQMNEVLLQDNGSKFGTLQLLQKPVELTPESPLFLQLGQTLMSFELVRFKPSLYKKCCQFFQCTQPEGTLSQSRIGKIINEPDVEKKLLKTEDNYEFFQCKDYFPAELQSHLGFAQEGDALSQNDSSKNNLQQIGEDTKTFNEAFDPSNSAMVIEHNSSQNNSQKAMLDQSQNQIAQNQPSLNLQPQGSSVAQHSFKSNPSERYGSGKSYNGYTNHFKNIPHLRSLSHQQVLRTQPESKPAPSQRSSVNLSSRQYSFRDGYVTKIQQEDDETKKLRRMQEKDIKTLAHDFYTPRVAGSQIGSSNTLLTRNSRLNYNKNSARVMQLERIGTVSDYLQANEATLQNHHDKQLMIKTGKGDSHPYQSTQGNHEISITEGMPNGSVESHQNETDDLGLMLIRNYTNNKNKFKFSFQALNETPTTLQRVATPQDVKKDLNPIEEEKKAENPVSTENQAQSNQVTNTDPAATSNAAENEPIQQLQVAVQHQSEPNLNARQAVQPADGPPQPGSEEASSLEGTAQTNQNSRSGLQFNRTNTPSLVAASYKHESEEEEEESEYESEEDSSQD